ncbi:FAD/NAD(P)-binding domain-containing protein [Xylariomycetidae sp. FL0641]|nr:FAD/NAD(P)-binding domain-containing protein [Xylariomycetidae sp. FL0641]
MVSPPLLLAAAGLLSLAASAAVLPAAAARVAPGEVVASPTVYDCVIVGGGPAGLAALSGLARVRRNVLLLDSGVYRNGATRHMHDVLGFDGVTPAYFRWAAREQLAYYDTVSAANGTVTGIEANDDGTFTVQATYLDGQESTVGAKKIVLATGLEDILPSTPGIEKNWGKGIYWCPWCDGNEHADQALGILADLPSAAGMVREVATLNRDVVAFVNGSATPAAQAAAEAKFPGYRAYLALRNVTVENRTIAAVTRLLDASAHPGDPALPSYPEHDLFRVEFADGGAATERAALFAEFPNRQASGLGAGMGVRMYGERLGVDPTKGLVTSVPGVYAVGDANSDNVTNVPHALFSGKRTAVYLHVQLAREEAQAEIAAANATDVAQRDLELDPRAVWEVMNPEPRDILYAGEFEV